MLDALGSSELSHHIIFEQDFEISCLRAWEVRPATAKVLTVLPGEVPIPADHVVANVVDFAVSWAECGRNGVPHLACLLPSVNIDGGELEPRPEDFLGQNRRRGGQNMGRMNQFIDRRDSLLLSRKCIHDQSCVREVNVTETIFRQHAHGTYPWLVLFAPGEDLLIGFDALVADQPDPYTQHFSREPSDEVRDVTPATLI